MGVRRCLARFLTSLAPMRTQRVQTISQQFIPAGFPLTTNLQPGGRKTQPKPHHTGHESVRTRPPTLKIFIAMVLLDGIPAFLGYFLLRGAVFLIFTRLLSSAFGKVNVIISSISPLSFSQPLFHLTVLPPAYPICKEQNNRQPLQTAYNILPA